MGSQVLSNGSKPDDWSCRHPYIRQGYYELIVHVVYVKFQALEIHTIPHWVRRLQNDDVFVPGGEASSLLRDVIQEFDFSSTRKPGPNETVAPIPAVKVKEGPFEFEVKLFRDKSSSYLEGFIGLNSFV